ncbi:MAG: hypothetical protein JO056_11625 [Alphaproteobacteria bacterium]|nr:hypothetical protein [Alphaproteobacteria bacterium]
MIHMPLRLGAALLLAAAPNLAAAHGILGDRFFPATITVDDPFAADELALPTMTFFRHSEDGEQVFEKEYAFEYSKTIFPRFALSLEGGYVDAKPVGTPAERGFGNLTLSAIYQFIRDPESEFTATGAFRWEIGGSGSRDVAGRASSYTPTLLFGKGFGDLPESAAWLRPFAVTGTIGYTIPGHGDEPNAIQWGGAVEYSLRYLQSNVRDQGFGPFVSQLTPLVEFSFSSPVNKDGGGTTGTINPGILWSGQSVQLGVEAILPVNSATGHNVGVVAQLHFYIDDIFPHSLGTPLFGGVR